MKVWLWAVVLSLALGTPALSEGLPSTKSQVFNMEFVIGPGGWLIHAFRDQTDKTVCTTIDPSTITPAIAETSGTRIVSQAFVRTGNGPGMYYLWVIEPSGIHTVFRATYLLTSCTLTELKSKQSYYSGDNRNKEASEAYNAMLRDALAGK
jgi:hypothetical protein